MAILRNENSIIFQNRFFDIETGEPRSPVITQNYEVVQVAESFFRSSFVTKKHTQSCDLEITLSLANGLLCIADGKSQRVDKNCVHICFRGQKHTLSCNKSSRFQTLAVNFRGEDCRVFLQTLRNCEICGCDITEELAQIVSEFAVPDTPFFEQRLDSLITACLVKLARGKSMASKQSVICADDLLPMIINYIDSHFLEICSADDIASHFGYTYEHISRLFKKNYGFSPMKYLNDKKIEYSQTLLQKGMTLSEIAETLGYSNACNFSRAFKNKMGFSPKGEEKMNYWTQSDKNVFVAAHRGFRSKYPENTLLAFEKAIELGVDQIETDVRVTLDGELVLIHDADVDRTTNGSGKVCEYTLDKLRKLDAGGGEKIPTLIEFMELVKEHPTMTLDIELKEYPIGEREQIAYDVCDRVLAVIDSYGFTDRVVINSWNGKLNEYINEKYGKKYRQHVYYPVRHLGKVTKDPYDYGYCTCICGINKGEVSADEVKALHEKYGIGIWAGSYAKDENGVDLAVSMGAELITCDNPDDVLNILRSKKLHK